MFLNVSPPAAHSFSRLLKSSLLEIPGKAGADRRLARRRACHPNIEAVDVDKMIGVQAGRQSGAGIIIDSIPVIGRRICLPAIIAGEGGKIHRLIR